MESAELRNEQTPMPVGKQEIQGIVQQGQWYSICCLLYNDIDSKENEPKAI